MKKGYNYCGLRHTRVLLQKSKQAKGITLIALVITIIVLLILAGVTIAMIAGPNGILSKAQSAKIQNEKASIREQIELAVVTSRLNDKNDTSIDTSILETELNKINGISSIERQGTYGNLPWMVTVDGFKFQIKEDGTVESVDGISLSQTLLKMVEGQEPVTITATLTEGLTGNVEWSSSDTSVATVANGTVTAVGTSGTATITAKVSGTDYSAICQVTIVQKVTTISVSDLTIEEGSSSQLTVTTTPSSNIEDLTYKSSNENIAKVNSAGEVTGVAEGTATITVSGKISKAVTKTCTVTVTKPKGLEIGDYVEYNVTYTDMYSSYAFTATDGWRVLDPGTKNADGSYSGVKLISTGIPAKLYYEYSTVKNFEKDDAGTIGKWTGNSTQREEYANTFYASSSNDNNNMYASAGLYYNFGKILFSQGTSSEYNKGFYTKVNGKTEGNLEEDEFIVNGKATEVHNLTLTELNKARGYTELTNTTSTETKDGDTGLFYLRGLANEKPNFGYSTSINPYYWLASPNASSTNYLRYVTNDGSTYTSRYGTIRSSPRSFSKI